MPGYGLAVAQGQQKLYEFVKLLQAAGVEVKFAIHPVAGRMPGQMDVLLAEAGVPYDLIFQLEDINDEFANTDVALVIGANDVVNPAARTDKSSPIFGMPILNADKAKKVYVVKRGEGKGYAGIVNALFYGDNCDMVYGDAQAVLVKMIEAVRGLGAGCRRLTPVRPNQRSHSKEEFTHGPQDAGRRRRAVRKTVGVPGIGHSVSRARPDPGQDRGVRRVPHRSPCRAWRLAVEAQTLPFIPGHEGIGLVAAVGSGVTIVKEGDRVGVPWLYSACGHCEYCLSAWETVCAEAQFGGYTKNGGFAEYIIADPELRRPYTGRSSTQGCRAAHLRRHHHLQRDQGDRGKARRMDRHIRRWRPGASGHSICQGHGTSGLRGRHRRRQARARQAALARISWSMPRPVTQRRR